MGPRLAAAALALLMLILSPPPAVACQPADGGRIAADLGRATNALRAGAGLPPLTMHERLARAAQAHACDLAARQQISHQDRQGRLPMKRLRIAGFAACFSAENLAMGLPDAAVTVRSWQASPRHARNQQDARARVMGFGVARGPKGRLWWVGVYAAPCPRVASSGRPAW